MSADLQTKGLLDQTLVVLRTEFGRTSWINRDHHPGRSLACWLGLGLRVGSPVSGQSTSEGESSGTDVDRTAGIGGIRLTRPVLQNSYPIWTQ